MPATTWLNRLIDESNTWFLAVKSEDSSRFVDAVIYYLKDATECSRKQLQLQAALSCASAASCLEKSGDAFQASKLYREASMIYENNSKIVGKTIQERIWSLERAYYFSLLARDVRRATELHNQLLSIQIGNPISSDQAEQKILEPAKSAGNVQTPQRNDVLEAIDEFLNIQHTPSHGLQEMAVGKQVMT